MRALALVHPGDDNGADRYDQYLFGPDLLVAPALDPGVTSREVYLPEGDWVDLWRSARYASSAGGLALGRAAVLPGRRTVRVPAPLTEIPLLVRAGSVLPLLPADVDTLTSFGSDRSVVRLQDRRDRLSLLAFPRGRSASTFVAGGRLVSRESRTGWSLDVRDGQRRTYDLQASMATLRSPFAPCVVRLDDQALPRSAWSYDSAAKVLRATFTTAFGSLQVAPCAVGSGGTAVSSAVLPSTGGAAVPAGLAALLVLTAGWLTHRRG